MSRKALSNFLADESSGLDQLLGDRYHGIRRQNHRPGLGTSQPRLLVDWEKAAATPFGVETCQGHGVVNLFTLAVIPTHVDDSVIFGRSFKDSTHSGVYSRKQGVTRQPVWTHRPRNQWNQTYPTRADREVLPRIWAWRRTDGAQAPSRRDQNPNNRMFLGQDLCY